MIKIIFTYIFISMIVIDCLADSKKRGVLKPLVPSESYTHNEYVNENDIGQYVLFWKVLSNREIQFEIHCRTIGWVGLGVSTNGGMKGADIAIGWFDSHGAHLKDCYAKGNLAPIVDHEQNWFLLDGAEIDGYTILKFKRSLYTCDLEHDKEIKNGITYLIFAWDNHDPTCDDWKYHSINRFTKSLLLLTYRSENNTDKDDLPLNTITYDLKVKDVELPATSSYYYCELFEFPKFKNDNHLLKLEMLIDNDSKNYVHYLIGFECDDGFIPAKKIKGDECDYLPNDIKKRCKSKVFNAWSYGSKYNYSFINTAGYKILKKNETKYVLLEIYYNNINLMKNKIDNSGIRLYMSSALRQNDIGILAVTTDSSPLSLQIPSHSKHYHYSTICYPQCTEKFLLNNGIYLFSGLLYTHSAGVSVKLSLIRNGKLITRLFENENFDPRYQHVMDIEPFKISKGDSFLLECEYNTENRTQFTLNGFSRTTEETCSAYLYYYPKIEGFEFCESPFSYESLFEFYQELINHSLMPDIKLSEDQESLNRIETILRYQMPNSPKLTHEFENYFKSHYPKMATCGTPSAPNQSYIHELPHYNIIENLIEESFCDFNSYPDTKCNKSNRRFNVNLFLLLVLQLIKIELITYFKY